MYDIYNFLKRCNLNQKLRDDLYLLTMMRQPLLYPGRGFKSKKKKKKKDTVRTCKDKAFAEDGVINSS